MAGVPGFFSPRFVSPMFAAPGTPEAMSFYDSAPLKATLNELIDWDLLNHGPVRLSVGAVDVESGNFHYFDTTETTDRRAPHHGIGRAATGAAASRDRRAAVVGWWPRVEHAADACARPSDRDRCWHSRSTCFSAATERPRTIMDVMAREKEIRFSSRTRQVSDQVMRIRKDRELTRKVVAKLPPESLWGDPDVDRAVRAIAGTSGQPRPPDLPRQCVGGR